MTNQKIDQFLALVNRYPSPHNGQPMRLKKDSEGVYEIYFQKERGLQSVDISFIFSFVTVGVFARYLELAGKALGLDVQIDMDLPSEGKMSGSGLLKCGEVVITDSSKSPDDDLLKALEFRQTSRKKYISGVPDSLAQQLIESSPAKFSLTELDRQKAHATIWLNQRAVFDDMFEEPVRKELDHWLRYSESEKLTKPDGLAYDCMQINGWIMKSIVDHPRFLRAPVIKQIIKQYYLRTMRDNSSVFYTMAPFENPQDAFNVGVFVMNTWSKLSEHGLYLHPFGSIMSNHHAHHDFIDLVGEMNETRANNYLVFIFRAGKSERPPRSLRLPVKDHLLIT